MFGGCCIGRGTFRRGWASRTKIERQPAAGYFGTGESGVGDQGRRGRFASTTHDAENHVHFDLDELSVDPVISVSRVWLLRQFVHVPISHSLNRSNDIGRCRSSDCCSSDITSTRTSNRSRANSSSRGNPDRNRVNRPGFVGAIQKMQRVCTPAAPPTTQRLSTRTNTLSNISVTGSRWLKSEHMSTLAAPSLSGVG